MHARAGPCFERSATSALRSVAFSPDGTRIVTGNGDYWTAGPSDANVWDARTGRRLLELKGHEGWVTSVAFSPDGTRIVTGGDDEIAKVWDARAGTLLLELRGHTGAVMGVAFSPDGTRIVTGGDDQTAKVWDARSGTPPVELTSHACSVTSVAFSPDGANHHPLRRAEHAGSGEGVGLRRPGRHSSNLSRVRTRQMTGFGVPTARASLRSTTGPPRSGTLGRARQYGSWK